MREWIESYFYTRIASQYAFSKGLASFFYSCFCQTTLPPRARTTSNIFAAVYNALSYEPHRYAQLAYRNVQTGIPRLVLHSIYSRRYWEYLDMDIALYMYLPPSWRRKDVAGKEARNAREGSLVCASLCLSGGSEPWVTRGGGRKTEQTAPRKRQLETHERRRRKIARSG